MTYTVEFSPSARKMFKKLPQNLQDRIQPKIDALATEPRPNGAKKLKGEENPSPASSTLRFCFSHDL